MTVQPITQIHFDTDEPKTAQQPKRHPQWVLIAILATMTSMAAIVVRYRRTHSSVSSLPVPPERDGSQSID